MAKTPIKVISPNNRNVVPGDGVQNNIFVKSGDYNQLVTRVNENTVDIEAVLAGNTFQGNIDCGANPNYPAATENYWWVVSVAGKIGGVAGTDVEVGDMIICNDTNAGGTQAAVGSKFTIVEHNFNVGPTPVPIARAYSPINGTFSVNENIVALDVAIGQDAELLAPYNVTAGTSAYGMASILDIEAYNNVVANGLGVFASRTEQGVLFTAREAGPSTITITLVDTGGVAGTVSVLGNAITVEIDDTVTLDTVVQNAINTDTTASKLVFVSGASGAALNVAGPSVLMFGEYNSTYPVDEGSPYISSTGFTALGLQPNMRNAERILAEALRRVDLRADHTMNPIEIIKHKNMAVVVYDFAVDGGGAGGPFPLTISLNAGVSVIPANAIVTRTIFDVITPVTVAGGGTVVFSTGGHSLSGDLVAIGAPSINDGLQLGLAATMFKSAADLPIDIITDTSAITAGKVKLFVEYIISE